MADGGSSHSGDSMFILGSNGGGEDEDQIESSAKARGVLLSLGNSRGIT
jgi:hypothetical protein